MAVSVPDREVQQGADKESHRPRRTAALGHGFPTRYVEHPQQP